MSESMTLAHQSLHSSPVDTQFAELRVVATGLWDCAARVAAGYKLDAVDIRGLTKARGLLQGAVPPPVEQNSAAVPTYEPPSHGQTTFAELTMEAANLTDDFGIPTQSYDEIVTQVIALIDQLAAGDREAAQTAELLFEHLADLTESLGTSSRTLY